jgi:hypothetical protein
MFSLIDLKSFLKREGGWALITVTVSLDPRREIVFTVPAFVVRFDGRSTDLIFN